MVVVGAEETATMPNNQGAPHLTIVKLANVNMSSYKKYGFYFSSFK